MKLAETLENVSKTNLRVLAKECSQHICLSDYDGLTEDLILSYFQKVRVITTNWHPRKYRLISSKAAFARVLAEAIESALGASDWDRIERLLFYAHTYASRMKTLQDEQHGE